MGGWVSLGGGEKAPPTLSEGALRRISHKQPSLWIMVCVIVEHWLSELKRDWIVRKTRDSKSSHGIQVARTKKGPCTRHLPPLQWF